MSKICNTCIIDCKFGSEDDFVHCRWNLQPSKKRSDPCILNTRNVYRSMRCCFGVGGQNGFSCRSVKKRPVAGRCAQKQDLLVAGAAVRREGRNSRLHVAGRSMFNVVEARYENVIYNHFGSELCCSALSEHFGTCRLKIVQLSP